MSEALRKAKNKYRANNKWRHTHAQALYNIRKNVHPNAIPKWANLSEIAEIYFQSELKTKKNGTIWHVDHIVPLLNKNVCGLHWEYNLRSIPGKANWKKNNKFKMPRKYRTGLALSC